MTTEQYKRMLRLKHDVHSTYGFPPKSPKNLQKLYEEYLRLKECIPNVKEK